MVRESGHYQAFQHLKKKAVVRSEDLNLFYCTRSTVKEDVALIFIQIGSVLFFFNYESCEVCALLKPLFNY